MDGGLSMDEYINREVAVKAFNNFDAGRSDSSPTTLLTPEEFAEYLYKLPTVDVAPVVRCENCKHRIYKYVNDWVGEIGGCSIFNHPMPNDAFCSYGERKEGADREAD